MAFKVADDHIDEEGFATVWNICADTVGTDLTQVRDVAGRVLGFLCKHNAEFVVATSNNVEYLDEKFEQDKKVLYDWKKESEMVDLFAQHVEVHFETLRLFLANRRYKPDANYSPVRKDRVAWFQETIRVA